jgi:choline-sulfatase
MHDPGSETVTESAGDAEAQSASTGLWATGVRRVVASAAFAAVGSLAAAFLDARFARAAEAEPPPFGSLFLADAGLIFPVALVVGIAAGVGSWFLHPKAAPSVSRLAASLSGVAGAERGRTAALCLLAPLATAGFIVAAARIGLSFLSSEAAPKAAAAGGVLGVVAVALLLWAVVLGASRALGSRLAGMSPLVLGGIGVAVGAGLIGYAIATGTTSGAGGTLAIFGVMKRAELDLRAPGLLLLIAAVAYAGPALVARLPAWLLVVVALAPAALTVRASGSGLSERRVSLAAERSAPLGKLALARLRKLTDRDHDGFSARFGGGDCNDADPAIGPGADDVPGNGIDEDCTGHDAEVVKIEKGEPEPPKDAREWALSKIPEKLNLVLITIDTLRWDLGYAGNPRKLSPSLDALAKKGVVFDKAYSLASYTSKSLPPALIGKFPSETHRGWAHFNRFEKSDIFIQERLQTAGIRTVSVQGYWYFFQPGVGFERGFDVIDSSAASKAIQVEGDKSSNSDRITDAAIHQLDDPANTGKQFYLWAHYVDPHAEYVVHDGFDFGPKSRDRYDSEVAFVDHHVGRLIDHIEKSKYAGRTAIIITSDHGEAFGEHGLIRHGFEVWEELIRVPFIVYFPGVAHRDVQVRRSAIDLVPTILDLYRLPHPKGEGTDFLSGVSLLLDLTQPPGYQPKERIVLSHMAAGPNNADRAAFIENDLKLITSDGRPLGLYDLASDADEKHDLLDDADKKEKVMARFRAFMKELREVKVKH